MAYNYFAGSGTNFVPSSATLTGGTVNGMTIGATTPSTGAFTTLTATTPTAGNSSTSAATTAYVQNLFSGVTALTSTGGSQTLTTVQAGAGILSLTGTLASAATLVVPNNGRWIVVNGTTGAFTTTVKTSAGTGVLVTQGSRANVFADGTNVINAVNTATQWALFWGGGVTVANGTYTLTLSAPYAGTINSADYVTAASTSFIFNVQIGGVSVTSLSAITVNSATAANTAATGANTFAAGAVITVIITSATSSPTNAMVALRITKA